VKTRIEGVEKKSIDTNGQVKLKFDTSEISYYDVRGNLIKTKRFYSGGYRRILYTYDSENRKIKEATYDNESPYSMGGSTFWEYDSPDYIVVEKESSYQTVVSKKTPNESHYFENGELKRVTKETFNAATLTHTSNTYDENNKFLFCDTYKVDSKNRMIEQKSFNDDLSLSSTVTYTFDANGNEIEMEYKGKDGSGYKDVSKFNEKKLKTEFSRIGPDGRVWGTTIFVYEYYQ
jgi:hypothetical protein